MVRQSLLSEADICLRRWWYARHRTDVPTASPASAIGTAYHEGVATFYRCLVDGEIPENAYARAQRAARDRFDEIASSGNARPMDGWQDGPGVIATMLASWFERRVWRSLADVEVLAIELPWQVTTTDGTVVQGTCDLVLKLRATGTVIVEDHKTARRPWPTGKGNPVSHVQAAVYTWAVQHLFGTPDLPGFVLSVMSWSGSHERRYVDVGEQHVRLAARRIRALRSLQDRDVDELPPSTSSPLCSQQWCPWWDLCEFGGRHR